MQCPVCGADHQGRVDACPVCGADLALLAPGTVIADRYEIKGLLGRGGMGSVFRAFDRVLDEDVALKVQLAEAARSPAAERRFRTEVKLARQVSHPNVCRLHDGGQHGASRWISMELVQGTTVAARLRDGPLPTEEAWDVALQAADGLAAVHRAGVVHRDLKPLNLMIDRSGRVRLMDFGIARPATGDATGGGYAQGSPEYMSPEQARGRPADAPSDVYSLGIVVFELFTGRVPFRADSPVATLLQHLEAPPPLDQLPPALRPVVGRALAKDPGERFPDGAAMAMALRRARDGQGQPARSRRGLVIAASVAAAVLLLLVLSILPRSRRPEPVPSPPSSSTPARTSETPPPSPPGAGTPAPQAAAPLSRGTPRPTAATEPRVKEDSPPGEEEAPATPAPTPTPPEAAATPAAREGAAPSPGAAEAEEEPVTPGGLLVVARPWADVSVDGIPRGQTPLGRIALDPGPHQVLLVHPDFRPYPRRVVIPPGETVRLVVDLRTDGVRRP